MTEPKLNEIVVLPLVDNSVSLAVTAPLFNIESTNTIEARIQSVSTTTGNEHSVQKLSNESEIATKIPNGQVVIASSTTSNKNIQPFVIVQLKEVQQSKELIFIK